MKKYIAILLFCVIITIVVLLNRKVTVLNPLNQQPVSTNYPENQIEKFQVLDTTSFIIEIPEGIKLMRFILNYSYEINVGLLYPEDPKTRYIVQMKLTSSKGEVYGPGYLGNLNYYEDNIHSEIMDIANPDPGSMKIEIMGSRVPPEGILARFDTIVFETEKKKTYNKPFANTDDYYIGKIGQDIQFSASGSWDTDGGVEKVEWDFENDGIYDVETEDFETNHTYFSEFIGLATLRVTDNDGLQSTDIAHVYILNPQKYNYTIAPVAVAHYDAGAYEGLVGIKNDFSAYNSTDPDGKIVLYEWDFNGDGIYDISSSDITAQYVFEEPFSGEVVLRVTDNSGLQGIGKAPIFIKENSSRPVLYKVYPQTSTP